MTDEELTKERNVFLLGFLGLIVAAVVLVLAMTSFAHGQEALMVAVAVVGPASKAASLYLVFRLSRFLGHPPWLTGLYVVLAFFAALFLIPFVALLVGVKNARSRVSALGGSPAAAGPPAPDRSLPVAQASDPEVCTGCGAPLRPDHRFCHSCGQAMQTPG